MKKVIVAVLLIVGVTTFAQEKEEKSDEKVKLTPEQKINLLVKKMTRDLDLNEKQQKEYKSLIAKQVENIDAKKAELKELKGKDKKDLKAKIQVEQDAITEEIKKILTPEQYLKWEKIREERKEKMEEKREKKKLQELPETK